MSQWTLCDLLRTLSVALSALALLAPATASAQRLRRASDAVHTGSSDRRRNEPSGDSPRSPSSSSSGGGGSRWLRPRYFLPYPYAWGYQGYATPQADFQRSPRSVAVVASLDGGIALSSIARGGVALLSLIHI